MKLIVSPLSLPSLEKIYTRHYVSITSYKPRAGLSLTLAYSTSESLIVPGLRMSLSEWLLPQTLLKTLLRTVSSGDFKIMENHKKCPGHYFSTVVGLSNCTFLFVFSVLYVYFVYHCQILYIVVI